MPTGQADRLIPTLRRVVLARQSAARSDGDLLGAFIASRDADAFAELVRRHGPMVLGVCRRLVGDRTTADDAFQATFIVLARRAAAVRPREQVGNWLYGVAYRTALKARMVLARRRSREKQVDVMPEPAASAAPAWNDLQPVIDEELAKLPDKLRVPVVLCDLEGRPQREVAKHLNVPPATLATRLASARRTLAARLTRRGVTLSGGALAGLLGTHASASAVSPALTAGLVRAAEAGATGGALSSLVSANAVQLSEGVMRMLMLAKLKAVAVATVTALALTTGLGLGLVPAAAGDEPIPAPGPTPAARLAPPAAPANDRAAARPKDGTAPQPESDDATFLRRLCLDLRGTPATPMELHFFIADEDDGKRAKVVEWMTDDDSARALLAKKLGVPVESVKLLRVRLAPDGKSLTFVTGEKPTRINLNTAAIWDYAADGKRVTLTARGTGGDQLTTWARLHENKTTLAAIGDWFDLDSDGQPDVLIETTDARRSRAQKRTLVIWDEKAGKLVESAPADSFFRVWGYLNADDKNTTDRVVTEAWVNTIALDTDADFLKRVLMDVRGNAPTALELKYFTEDKDPKKREKLIDTLLKDAAVQKKLGDAWKAKMLAPRAGAQQAEFDRLFLYVVPEQKRTDLKVVPFPLPPQPPAPPAPPVSKYEKLVGELIAAKKTDAEVLEALTLTTLSRLPTDSEKKLTLASIGRAADRKAAWVAVAKALANEPHKPEVRNIELKLFTPPTPPTPPAKP